jgi:DNA repair exonuclease SbcCD ATPase subunit
MTNFRCHVNSRYEIPDIGMIQLSGDGGAGKSTTLLGIIYALYGKMPLKVKKNTHGKTTCSVELEYMGLKITRIKPTIVVVEILDESLEEYQADPYEGDAAQSIIEKRMGMTYDEFVVGAFVHGRRSGASVISMTPTEQLNFINILSRESAQAAELAKSQIKHMKKELDVDLLKLKGKEDALNKQKEELEASFTIVPVPDIIKEGLTPDDLRSKIEYLVSHLSKINIEVAELSTLIEKERSLQKKRNDVQKKIDALHTEIKQLESMLVGVEPPTEEDMSGLVETLLSYESTIEHYESYIAYMKDKSVLHEAIDAIEENANQRINELENIIIDDDTLEAMRQHASDEEEYAKRYAANLQIHEDMITKKEEARVVLASIFHKIKLMNLAPKKEVHPIKTPKEMITFLNKMMNKKKKDHRNLMVKMSPKYECPGCSCAVVIYEEGLVLYENDDGVDDDEMEADNIKTTIKIIETHIKDIEDAAKYFNVKPIELGNEPEDYTSLYKEYFANMNLKEEYESLLSRKLPVSIEKMKARIDKMSAKFKDEGSIEECQIYLKQLKMEMQTKISEQEAGCAIIEEHQSHQTSINAKQKSIAALNKTLDGLKTTPAKAPKSNNLEDLEKKLNDHTRKIVDVNTSITKYRNILDGLAEYEARQTTLKNIESLAEKIETIQSEEQIVENKLEGSYGLEEAAKEAEILVLEKTTESINAHAKIYLDAFFNKPISVKLICIKNSKSAGSTGSRPGYKLQFNTVIEYEGSTYDNVEELSDSERQRCELAFLFAVNDMVGSPILIMDESVNCMSPEMNMEMLNLIHDLCGHKLVLMISHEAVRGVFDHEIPITHTNA